MFAYRTYVKYSTTALKVMVFRCISRFLLYSCDGIRIDSSRVGGNMSEGVGSCGDGRGLVTCTAWVRSGVHIPGDRLSRKETWS